MRPSEKISEGQADRKPGRARTACVILIFLTAIGIYAVRLKNRALDQPSWRECDVAAIARNFYREGMNPLYPRIDWRGNGPGFTEMEFPFHSWGMALAYHAVGIREVAGRFLSLGITVLSIFALYKLASRRLSAPGALAATLFFALNPLVVELSTALQPEPWMVLGCILSVYFFTSWLQAGQARHYFIALAGTSFAILAKANAAYLGILFAALVIERWGLRIVRIWRVWTFAVLSLAGPILWYSHAFSLWQKYGNSLGVSNESHFFGLDLLRNPAFLLMLPRLELDLVWTAAGAAGIALGLLYFQPRPAVRLEYWWVMAIFVYYLVTMRSSAHGALYYYHVISVPIAALMMGLVVDRLFGIHAERRGLWLCSIASMGCALVATAIRLVVTDQVWERRLTGLAISLGIAAGMFILRAGIGRFETEPGNGSSLNRQTRFAVLVSCVFLLGAAFAGQIYRLRPLLSEPAPHGLYRCALEFRRMIPQYSLIVASGGHCHHPAGGSAAYDAPYMFYWLDLKGFSLCRENQTLLELEQFRRKGARFFVAEKESMQFMSGFEHALRTGYRVIADCDAAVLFALEK